MFIAIPEKDGTRYINRDNINEYIVDEDNIVIFYKDDSTEIFNFKSAEIAEEVGESIAYCTSSVYVIDKDDLADE